MARIADPEKMENIKKAVIECIIEYGYSGVSTALICEKASVSPGYLYRYYNSKDELVKELVDSEMQAIYKIFVSDIENSNTLLEAANKIVKKLFLRTNASKITAKFTSTVVMDLKIPAAQKSDNFKQVIELANKCIKLGIKTGEINTEITPIEVLAVSFTIPFRYILLSLEMEKNKSFTDEEAKKIAKLCINAFK